MGGGALCYIGPAGLAVQGKDNSLDLHLLSIVTNPCFTSVVYVMWGKTYTRRRRARDVRRAAERAGARGTAGSVVSADSSHAVQEATAASSG